MKIREEKLAKIVSYLVMGSFALICIIPLIMIVIVSFTSERSIKQNGFQLIPEEFSLDAYRLLAANPGQLINAYGVTIFNTVVGTVLSVILVSQIAYTVSRKTFLFRKQLNLYIYITMLFSGGMVPTYILVSRYLNLRDSLWAIIITMLISPWNIFLLRTFFSAIPDSLIESAKLDGASEFRIFYQIIVPLSSGGIATVAITTAMGYWNDWYNNMLYISDVDKYSLQYLLQALLGKIDFMRQASNAGQIIVADMPQESLRMATCVAAVGPMVIIFLFFQKYFIKGMTAGAVKG